MMTLPHFLLLIVAVILIAGLTLWAASAAGLPLAALAIPALIAAAAVHLAARVH
ncbi:hypothetical protein [Paracoccus suum]|uniref:hypothetical protein n=1 Tax=Paracoccus suum TaxID=2259340 RepID=UPI0013B063A3|nr:hypothetical protein [Paracoccus suum]